MTATKQLMDLISAKPPIDCSGPEASDALGWILYHIHAMPSLAYFPLVLDTLRKLINTHGTPTSAIDPQPTDPKDTGMQSVIHWLSEHQADWIYLIDKKRRYPDPKSRKGHPLRNQGISIHPHYALLMCRNDDASDANQQDILALQHLLLVINWAIMAKINAYDQFTREINDESRKFHQQLIRNYKSSIYESARAAMELTQPVYSTKLSEFVADYPLHRFINRARSDEKISLKEEAIVQKINLLCGYAFTNDKPPEREGGKRSKRKNAQPLFDDGFVSINPELINLNLQPDPDDDDAYWPHLALLTPPLSDPDLAEEEETPLEDIGPDEFLVFRGHKELPPLSVLRNAALHIQKEAQLLPHKWENLIPYEIAELLNSTRSLILSQRDRKQQYFGLLIVLQLATGLSVQSLSGLLLSRTGYAFGEERPVYLLPDGSPNGFWCLPAYAVHYRSPNPSTGTPSQTDSQPGPEPRALAGYVVLPDYFQFDKLLESLERLPGEHSTLLFSESPFTTAVREYPKFLKQSQTESRLTPHRLSMVFRQYLLSTGSGLVEHSLCTGIPSKASTVPAHYSAPSVSHLLNSYQRAMDQLQADLQDERCHLMNRPTSMTISPSVASSQQDRHVGSRYCPNTEDLQALIASILSVIEDPTASNIDVHNQYTLYLILMIAYSTGIRAVRQPKIHQQHLDPNSQRLMISDKNTPDFYHSRWVWVPDLLRDQLRHYDDYRTQFAQHNEHHVTRHPLFEPDEVWFHTLLFIDDHLRPVSATPKTIRLFGGPLMPPAANHSRHWLRTRMMEAGLPEESINQFMGHWSMGEEPFGKHSTTSPAKLLECTKPFITDCLAELGFRKVAPKRSAKRLAL